MNFDRMFNPQGLNWWIVVSGMGMNFVAMTFLIIALVYGSESGLSPSIYTLAMSIGGFGIPLLTAYVCGRMGDERYLAYAFYPLVGYLMPVLFGITQAGVLGGLLMVLFGVLGAFNGGSLAARRANRRRHYMPEDE